MKISTILKPRTDTMSTSSMEDENSSPVLRDYWYCLHRRYWRTNHIQSQSNDILIARALSILLWFYVVLIEFVGYSHLSKSSATLTFLFTASYPWKDVSAIIYASGAAAYGISIEAYLIIPLVVVNSIFAVINCRLNHSETIDSLTYTVKVIVLFLATELSHQNFKRFTYQNSYQLRCLSATRAMLRQSIYLTVTIMFLISPGLRAIYNAARFKCQYLRETTNGSSCQLIDINKPTFGDNDPCMPDFSALVTSFEQLRIIRDIALFSIAFNSMYNKAFLDITGTSSIIHKILVILFVTMSWSYIVANIDPLQFDTLRLYFSMIEIVIIVTVVALLIINLRKKCKHGNQVIMEANPTIFG